MNKINSKTWPYTNQDITHAEKTLPKFVPCEPPKATGISLAKQSNRIFRVTWGYDPGCVRGITVDRYRLVWEVEVPDLFGLLGSRTEKMRPKRLSGSASSDTFALPFHILNWNSVTVSIEIRPTDIAYGGFFGFENLFGHWIPESLIHSLGVYYDKQYPASRITR